MKIKNKIMILIGITTAILTYNTTCHAALQANGSSVAQYNLATWLSSIRGMEATGGTLGLSDTFNSDYTSAGDSNNLDIHMELNTEYGAMAILSASSYGNPNKIEDGETTTGNKSGVYISFNGEWVSAGYDELKTYQRYAKIAGKYKNIYTNKFVYDSKIGDATIETAHWHSTSVYQEISSSQENGLVRSTQGSIFACSRDKYCC